MTKPNPQLVADLARLAAKYPPEDWEGLLGFLRDPRCQADLVTLVEQLASASRSRVSGRAGTARPPGMEETLARVRTQDPQRADLLADVWSRLRQRELLPQMQGVRAFAEAVGLKGLASKKRDQAVNEVMRHIVDLPAVNLAAAIQQTTASDRGLGEEYERWVRLILGRASDAGEETHAATLASPRDPNPTRSPDGDP